jgi:hypothetical protein
MARKPATRPEFALFDVSYEDGSQRSNRRVPSELLGGLEGDAPARAAIEEQDRLIAERSGKPTSAEEYSPFERKMNRQELHTIGRELRSANGNAATAPGRIRS